jgi:hypothetical protein
MHDDPLTPADHLDIALIKMIDHLAKVGLQPNTTDRYRAVQRLTGAIAGLNCEAATAAA